MSKLVNEINLIIKNEKIEELGWKLLGINLSIKVEDINKRKTVEEAIKNYILENDCWESKKDHSKKHCTTKEKLIQYEVENIKYWKDDLCILIGLNIMHHVIEEEKIYNLIKKLEENKVKAYRLIDSRINRGWYLCDYAYTEGCAGGHIRCYETDRFIISFILCD